MFFSEFVFVSETSRVEVDECMTPQNSCGSSMIVPFPGTGEVVEAVLEGLTGCVGTLLGPSATDVPKIS